MLLAIVLPFALGGCRFFDAGPTPEQVRATLLRKLPATLHDRQGWARDIQTAFISSSCPTVTGQGVNRFSGGISLAPFLLAHQ